MKTIVLGIESTAHTFGVGIVKEREIIADTRYRYEPEKGGIHPRDAALYFMNIGPSAISEALRSAGISARDLTGVAVALGPGLGPCLRVGATHARAMATYLNKPLIPVNHAVAHIEVGKLVTNVKDPLIVYLSGGNTLIAAFNEGRYRVFGETLDIALGNFMDTFVREIGLAPPYVVNGVHQLDRCAEKGKELIDLPYVVKGQDVSFSGLLTAALRAVRRGVPIENVCYSVREIAYSAIVEVSERALVHTDKKEVLVVGGVAASKYLKEKFEIMSSSRGVELAIVPPKYAVDNGVMIAWTGLLAFKSGITIEPERAYVRQRWRLDDVDIPWFGQ
ncbi:MAG: N(6)-L-threonylcarbamoyladenine synthase Kae1 [Desulfurococcales archaeon]|nr:N(6)-L-threonylcarbamoyladenine synthase Kae1 [Desulfurococcales archaeon]